MHAGAYRISVVPRCLAVILVLVALTLSACGGKRDNAGPSCDKPRVAFEAPATRLTFLAPGANAAQIDETRRVLCDRLAGSGIAHRVSEASGERVVVELPKASSAAQQGAASSVFGAGRLAFYDWEPNVVGPGGRLEPSDADVTGGPQAGQVGAISGYDAVLRASQRPAVVEPDNAHEGSRFYAVDPKARELVASAPAGTKAQALAAVPADRRAAAKVYEVKPDTVVVRAEQPSDAGPPSDQWYVLRDDVALRGSEIDQPKQRFDEGPGSSGEPVVTFDFTAEGQRIWQEVTREIAERGRRSADPGKLPDGNQHFAIVLDDRIVSVPYIDFRANPGGIDGRSGSQIQGGFTIASAKQLAALLDSGPLPTTLVPTGGP